MPDVCVKSSQKPVCICRCALWAGMDRCHTQDRNKKKPQMLNLTLLDPLKTQTVASVTGDRRRAEGIGLTLVEADTPSRSNGIRHERVLVSFTVLFKK